MWLCLAVVAVARTASGTEPVGVNVLAPLPRQVVQREGYEPRAAHDHEPGGPKLGFALVPVELVSKAAKGGLDGATWEYRVTLLEGATGNASDWAPLTLERREDRLVGPARVNAGGWYRLELRAKRGEETVATAAQEPIGVGEVFLVAGQSYAVGANDEVLKIDDPTGRVVAFDPVQNRWQVANDPQPNSGDGGTIWPPMANLLLPLVRVPIGFVNVAVGGTATRQWLPGEKLYQAMAAAGSKTGRFRAVLWQQGESDVIEQRSTGYYVENMATIRNELAREWGFEPTWLLAKSTLHPTVYNDPAGEGKIRAAIDQLATMPGFRLGPDTDILGGENRGALGTRRHFSGIGQRRAGAMWFASVWNEINRQ